MDKSKMIKVVQTLFLFSIFIGFNCGKISNPESPKKVLFTLYTGPRDSASCVDVSFNSDDTLDEIPLITIGTFLPDTIENFKGFYRATFRKVHSDSLIHFKLKLYGDSIVDHIKVPGEIDSVFCNNTFIFGNYKDSTIYIDTASTYLFYWKTRNKGDFFSIEYYGDLNNDRDGSKFSITKDTFFTVEPEIKGLSHSFLKFKLMNCQGNKDLLIPDISSDKIDLYYRIWNTQYTCHIYMQ
jgi:hypothetical protein